MTLWYITYRAIVAILRCQNPCSIKIKVNISGLHITKDNSGSNIIISNNIALQFRI